MRAVRRWVLVGCIFALVIALASMAGVIVRQRRTLDREALLIERQRDFCRTVVEILHQASREMGPGPVEVDYFSGPRIREINLCTTHTPDITDCEPHAYPCLIRFADDAAKAIQAEYSVTDW